MTTQLINLNSLDLNEKNIWIDPTDCSEFGYSDGADEEDYLIDLLSKAQDVSMDSSELRRASRDWVSDYHLSAIRANLLKSINFSSQSKVLEVGCGCGALTRYLGEQGYYVDAVEGSATRAEISALRCRDLRNVNIVQHNFNTLSLPQGNYDAVLFIGVLEYARKFLDAPAMTSEQAVISLLKKAAACLSDNGIIIIAIENRTGLKYVNGAFEDHLAIADAGINNYKGYEFTGIKTYDSQQWQTIIEQTGLTHRLFYPFADYKFPNLVINSQVDENDMAFVCNQIHSQDPISPWVFPAGENKQWLNAMSSGTLDLTSNSFGLIVANGHERLQNIFKSNWTLFDKNELKPEFRIDLSNNRTTDYTYNNKELSVSINNSLEYKTTLSNYWQQCILEKPSLQTLAQLASQLRQLINSSWPQQKLVDIDQLYISDKQDNLDSARFWLTAAHISAEQQLFHFLLGFCISKQKFLASCTVFNFKSISELMHACLQKKDLALVNATGLTEFENSFRNQTQLCPVSVCDELAFIISSHDKYQFRHVNSQLFWRSKTGDFAADQSMSKRIKQTIMPQLLIFEGIDSNQQQLRFDPCDHEYGLNHYFCIHSIDFVSTKNQAISRLNKEVLTDAASSIHDLELINKSKLIFKVIGIDSQIKFSLPQDLSKITNRYNLEIKLQWLGM